MSSIQLKITHHPKKQANHMTLSEEPQAAGPSTMTWAVTAWQRVESSHPKHASTRMANTLETNKSQQATAPSDSRAGKAQIMFPL